MNYWWDTRAYQQSNKISLPSATGCVRWVWVMTPYSKGIRMAKVKGRLRGNSRN